MKTALILSLHFAMIVLTHCQFLHPSKADIALARSNNVFGVKVYDIISRESGNIVFSPFTVHAALSLLYYGADGKTNTVLKNVLELLSENDTIVAYKDLLDFLNKDEYRNLEIANKIYVSDTIKLVDGFKADALEYFSSYIENGNFRDVEETTDKMNTWVMEKTHGTIRNIIKSDKLGPSTTIISLNALYFYGKWLGTSFMLRSYRGTFSTSEMTTIGCLMMTYKGTFKYARFDGTTPFRVVRLPYENTRLSLTIVLPEHEEQFFNLEKELIFNRTKLTDLRAAVEHVLVTMPAFKIEQEIHFRSILRQIGLGSIFENIDIPKIVEVDDQLEMDDIIQKVSLDVGNKGINATVAMDGAVDNYPSIPEPQLIEFNVNRPFLFFLEADYKLQRHVLLQGRVTNPGYHAQ